MTAVTFTPHNNLNNNNAEFRSLEKLPQPVIIQQLSPNPATEFLLLRIFSKAEKEINIKVLSLQGQILLEQAEGLKEGLNFAELDINPLSSGIYFIQIDGMNGRRMPMKFVKQKL